MFRIQFWTIWTYFWNFEKSQKKSVLRQAAQPILPTAGNVIEHTPQPGRHQRHTESRGESRNTISSHSKKVWNQLWCVAVKARSILGGAISEHQGEQKLQREFADKRISIQWPDKPFFFFFLSKVLQQNFNSAQGILGGAPLMHPYLLF